MIARSNSLGLLATLLLAVPVSAAEIRGIVAKADPDRKEFTIEARGKGMRGALLTFQVDGDTQIRKGKDAGTLADLSAGERVRVVYDNDQGRRLALLVTIQVPLFAPTPAPAVAPVPHSSNGLSGTLRRVALTDREIVVITPAPQGGVETETILLVPQDAKITRDQKPIRFEDLKEGEIVTVTPEKKDGKLLAQSIQIGAGVPSAAAPPADNRIAKIRMVLKMIDLYLATKEGK
jgi:Cu/Ag efflux protein CusF